MGHEIDPGGRVGVDIYSARVDTLALPQRQELPSEGIVAQARDIGAGSAEPRCGDDAVRGVAAEALQVLRCSGASLVEFKQRFAQRDQIETGVALRWAHQRGAKAANPAANRAAT